MTSPRFTLRLVASFLTLVCLTGTLRAADPPAKKPAERGVARPSPEWLSKGVIYQIWLRSFTPEGTLKAATARLKSVADLGATIIYLSPVSLSDDDMRREFWSTRQKASGTNNPRNPYRIKDYNKVDPEYGTEDDLKAFVAEAHRLKLHVLLDLVYFHCGPTALLMEHPEYFKKDKNGNVSTGSWNFPVLNFDNKDLREHLWANMRLWIADFAFDGFRCDVADAVPQDFWSEARRRLTPLKPDFVLLAEGERKTDQLEAFDLNYAFHWGYAAQDAISPGAPASNLRTLWEKKQAERPVGARFMRFTENHDFVNDLRRADVVCGERGGLALLALNFTLDGVPMLYSGQEIADTSVQSIYAPWAIRWEAACLPKAQARYAAVQRLCQLRGSQPALTSGEVVWLDNDQPDAVLSFARRAGDQSTVTLVNLLNRTVKVRVSGASAAAYQPLATSAKKPAAWAPAEPLTLEGFGYFIGKP